MNIYMHSQVVERQLKITTATCKWDYFTVIYYYITQKLLCKVKIFTVKLNGISTIIQQTVKQIIIITIASVLQL